MGQNENEIRRYSVLSARMFTHCLVNPADQKDLFEYSRSPFGDDAIAKSINALVWMMIRLSGSSFDHEPTALS